jgi:phosphohistidine swiveling domain-containing protein
MSVAPSPSPHQPAQGSAGDAYRACLYGNATQAEQRATAMEVALLHGLKGELLDALKKCAAVCAGETLTKSAITSALEAARYAIAKAEAR